MPQELLDFAFFKQNQLKNVDFQSGTLDVWSKTKAGNKPRISLNVGSKNQDGYVRVWCNGKLRMKHRLLYWLYHGYLPNEIDHINSVRDDNSISNLSPSNRSHNTKNKKPRSYTHLTYSQVYDICEIIASNDYTITALANDFGRSRTQIKAILDKKSWSHISDEFF